ncbi:HAD family hydrolase [Streptomyces sp. NBC_01288]|uniref:HAD family hydrolase n=1 Tax=Streptomyces sp. NBC_01288 TaxID=2903814 RepID=UPI002E10B3B6|nr:HAD family hydrolase [Streptomyces sp. NBC_01288]
MAVDLDDVKEARELLAGARCVLFDFDGPICRLFPNGASRSVARALVSKIDELGFPGMLKEDVRTDDDPHAVLGAVYEARRRWDVGGLLPLLEAMVTMGELEAANKAVDGHWGTPGASRLIEMLSGRQVRLAVVTNNSRWAAELYLRRMSLRRCFEFVHGRATDLGLMKPDPDVLTRALGSLKLRPQDAVMIGDTGTDVEAARRAGVRFLGFGRNTRKVTGLRDAGAETVVSSYLPLIEKEKGRGCQ